MDRLIGMQWRARKNVSGRIRWRGVLCKPLFTLLYVWRFSYENVGEKWLNNFSMWVVGTWGFTWWWCKLQRYIYSFVCVFPSNNYYLHGWGRWLGERSWVRPGEGVELLRDLGFQRGLEPGHRGQRRKPGHHTRDWVNPATLPVSLVRPKGLWQTGSLLPKCHEAFQGERVREGNPEGCVSPKWPGCGDSHRDNPP